MIKHENGGAIATIGATRNAFGTSVSGSGFLSLKFFESYTQGITLGEMMKKAQFFFLNEKHHDFLTITEFILLGDPSLKIGGYD